ncbi:hypothetical protein PV325_005548 [Microctonus aethiopoides]|nr:hypothetical protein PV325_005548 [Microctonus aethiopoides]
MTKGGGGDDKRGIYPAIQGRGGKSRSEVRGRVHLHIGRCDMKSIVYFSTEVMKEGEGLIFDDNIKA